MLDLTRGELRTKIINEAVESIKNNDTTLIDAAINKASEQYLLELVEYIKGYKEFIINKNFTASLQHLDNALRLDPTLMTAHVTRGAVLIEMGDYEGAIKCNDYAIQNLMLTGYSIFYANKGIALARMGRLDEAMCCYLRAIEDNIHFEPAYLHAVSIAIEKGDFRILLVIAAQIRERFTKNTVLLTGMAGALLTALDKTLKISDLCISEQLITETGKILDIALAQDPNNVSIRYNYACLLSRMGKFDLSLEILEKMFLQTPLNETQLRLQAHARTDPDFLNLQDNPRFKKLLGNA